MLNQNGNATLEMVPVLILFVLLVNFTMGFFGIIHSGILNSIAARNYAFETFRDRANLTYLRDVPTSGSTYDFTANPYFSSVYLRFHSIIAENVQNASTFIATKRPIRFTDVNTAPDPISTTNDHTTVRTVMTDESQKTSEYFPGQTPNEGKDGVSPVWIMTTYGICLNLNCGGS